MKILIAAFCFLALAWISKAEATVCATCSCGITLASGVTFSPYSPTASAAATSNGSLIVTCLDTGLPGGVSYTIGLSKGSGNFATRTLKSGSNVLNYNLYTDAGNSLIWGDGTSGTSLVSDSYTVTVAGVKTYTIYSAIPALQNVPASVTPYSDTITVTLTY